MFEIRDRTYTRLPSCHDTKAAAGLALLQIAVKEWHVMRRRDGPALQVPEGKPLAPFALYVRRHDGDGLDLIGNCYAFSRENALRILLAAAASKTWPNTPAWSLYVEELTPAERRHRKRQEKADA